MAHATYAPLPIPDDIDIVGLSHYVVNELLTIRRLFNIEESVLELRASAAAPERPRIGMIAFADGTNWNPGSGVGLYVYKAAGWTFIV